MDARALLNGLDLGVAAIAPDGTIAEWSSGAARLTRLPPERAIGRSLWEAFPAAQHTNLSRVLGRVRSEGRSLTCLIAAEPVLEAQVTGGPRGHVVIAFQPVSEALSLESRTAALMTSLPPARRSYLQLFHSLPAPALLLTDEGQILEANAEGAKLLGALEPSDLRNRSLGLWLPPSQRGALVAGLRSAACARRDLDFRIDFAGEPVAEVRALVVNVAPGSEAVTLLLLAADPSREALLQRRLLQADRLSQVGGLISGVAHELNNPLAAIAAFAEMHATDTSNPRLKESAEMIRAEAMRAGRIVGTLLDFARQRPRVRAAVNLGEVVERVLSLQRSDLKKARVRAVVRIPDDLPTVLGDPQELHQVVLNAVVNARQAIEGTGGPGDVLIAAQRTDDHVMASIEDTGPGVPAEILDRVFEPFFTTKGDQGTGLGLAISFGLVRAMGGRMWMQNVEGGGARLSLELPLDTTRTPAAAPAQVRAPTRRLTVLVVEDEDNVRRGMVLLAKRLGHEVTGVGRFAEAAHHLTEPDSENYDVLLVDVHLDETHSGFDLFELLRQEGRGREQRVVFTTGDSISTRTRDQLQRSERPVLRKPFGLQELSQMLDRVTRIDGRAKGLAEK